MKTKTYIDVVFDTWDNFWNVNLVVELNGDFLDRINLAKVQNESQAHFFAELVEKGNSVNDVWDIFNKRYEF